MMGSISMGTFGSCGGEEAGKNEGRRANNYQCYLLFYTEFQGSHCIKPMGSTRILYWSIH